MTKDGYVMITGRIKDMINRGGENVSPLEVEEFLYTHPDIEEVQASRNCAEFRISKRKAQWGIR